MPTRPAKQPVVTDAPDLSSVREAQAAYDRVAPLVMQIVDIGRILSYAQKAVDEADRAKKEMAARAPALTALRQEIDALTAQRDDLKTQKDAADSALSQVRNQVLEHRSTLVASLKALDQEHAQLRSEATAQHQNQMALLDTELMAKQAEIEQARRTLEEIQEERRKLAARLA